jgi:predicted GNAT family acetyltransferase
MEDLKIINNKERSRFETDLGDDMAFIDHRFHDGRIYLLHTFVPESHRGQGIAGKIIKEALEYIKEHHLPLVVYCPAVTKYMDSHPEYKDLLDKQHG